MENGMMRSKLIMAFTLFVVCASACRARVDSPVPDVGVPVQEMNKRIVFRTPRELNTFRTNSIVYLEIQLNTEDQQEQVAFKSDFGARLFVDQVGKWVEIKNNGVYVKGDGYIILPPKNDSFPSMVQGVKPAIPDPNKATTLRIYLIGYICHNGQVTEEKTAAYIDVELNP